ncbi:MAG: hypothetical protein AAB342_00665 [Chloroflexota bacterium]
MGFSLLFLRPLLIDRTVNPLRHSSFDGTTINFGQPINAALSGGLSVLSTEFPSSVTSGSDFDVTLYLTPRQTLAADYRPRFDLSSADGLIWNNGNEALPPRWHKEPPGTQYWPVGQYAQWARRESVLPGTPPGDYQLTATVFDRATLAPDSVIDESGAFTSPIVSLGTVHVTRPAAPPSVADLDMQYELKHGFGPITLLGYNIDRSESRPGDAVLVTLFVRADQHIGNDLRFVFSDSQNLDEGILYSPPYPTSQWRAGDVWRLQALLRIPAEAASGPYQLTLALSTDTLNSIALQPIQVSAPDRLFNLPRTDNRTQIRFGDWIELAGYTMKSTADSLNLDLVWYALSTPNGDMLAFIHIEDATGRIVAQSDAVPANWTRPTTGWVAGEYIVDSRALPPLPPGEYTIYAGFADRVTGVRLPTAAGDRAVIGVYKAP